MSFVVTSNAGKEKMYQGMIMNYNTSPLFHIKPYWLTKITHAKELEYFVDEQIIDPYSMWHHQHKNEPIEGGVLMTDIVTYQPPMGVLGAIAHSILIKNQIEEIFNFRTIALEKRFGKFQ